MKNFNKQIWISNQLKDRSKTMPILSFPAVQLLGITVKELVTSSDNQAKAMKLITDICPTSASVSMMDLSVEAECFGSTVRFFDWEVPTVIGKIINDENDVNNLVVPKVGLKRDNTYIEAIKKASELISDRPVFAGVIGPFSLAGRLMDMTEIMINCYEEPQMVHTTLSKVTEFITNYILEFKKAGANGIVLAEPAAGLLSPDLCDEFSSKYVKKIVDAVKDDNFVFIYHNCGNTLNLIDGLLNFDADIYHFGNAINLEKMLNRVPNNKIVMGNIDPSKYLKNGTSESITNRINELLDECNKYDNFIISTGCDIPPMTKWDNIKIYFKSITDYYKNI